MCLRPFRYNLVKRFVLVRPDAPYGTSMVNSMCVNCLHFHRTKAATGALYVAMVIALSCSMWSVALGDEVQGPVSAWIEAAKAVEDLHVRFKGREVRIISEHPTAGRGVALSEPEVTLDYEIDYRLSRPDNEVYVRGGTRQTDRGVKSLEIRSVNFGGVQNELIVGGEDALRVYDQYVIRPAKPAHCPALEPLRFLLNIDHTGQGTFFSGRQIEPIAGAEQVIDGVACVLAESIGDEGVRIWFDPHSPHRIHKLEVGLAVAARQGHVECLYRYAADSTDKPFVFPVEWQLIGYTSTGDARLWITCNLQSATMNTNPDAEEFRLPIPPGAIVADRRAEEPAYFLQLADGTQQSIPVSSLGEPLVALSASVPGSRTEGGVGHDRLQKDGRWPVIALVAVVNVSVALLLLALFAIHRCRMYRYH